MADEAPLACSFCGKLQGQVVRLIAGPGVYIRNESVELCNEIISARAQDAARQPAPGWHVEAAIAHMVAVHRSRQYEQDLTAAVRQVRDAGITWARIWRRTRDDSAVGLGALLGRGGTGMSLRLLADRAA